MGQTVHGWLQREDRSGVLQLNYRVKRLKSFVKTDKGYIGSKDIAFTPTFLGIYILNQEYRLKYEKPKTKMTDPKPICRICSHRNKIKEIAIIE